MENSFQVNIVLSNEEMVKFNQIVSQQEDAQFNFIPKTSKVIKTDQEWIINFN